MTIYDTKRVRELANEQLKKDLNKDCELTNEQFNRYWLVFQISEHYNSQTIFEKWKFYLADNVITEIIDKTILRRMMDVYDIEECLEELKTIENIKGFFELGDDLWIINNRGE